MKKGELVELWSRHLTEASDRFYRLLAEWPFADEGRRKEIERALETGSEEGEKR